MPMPFGTFERNARMMIQIPPNYFLLLAQNPWSLLNKEQDYKSEKKSTDKRYIRNPNS